METPFRLKQFCAQLSCTWVLACVSCIGYVPQRFIPRQASVGHAQEGFVNDGLVPMTKHLMFVRPHDGAHHGNLTLVRALEHAASEVAQYFPGTAPMHVGDLGNRFGGAHPRHQSHRAGRDIDIMFFVSDPTGRSLFHPESHAYSFAATTSHPNQVFDEAKNWAMVRSFVLNDATPVQWIFCSRGIKSALLRYALATETNTEALIRAAYILQQPANARAHDDHFHLRFYCTLEELSVGCFDQGPTWPWTALRDHKAVMPSDEEVLTMLLDGM